MIVLRRAALVLTLIAGWACVALGQSAAPPGGAAALPAGGNPASAACPWQRVPPKSTMPTELSAPSAASMNRLASVAGLRVHDIEFRSASVVMPERLLALIPQKAGQPLEKMKLRESIQTLYATGRFADIQVEAERRDDGQLSLIFVAKENYFVSRISVQDAPRGGPTAHQLVNASKFELGELYTEEKLQRSLESMKRVLQDGGYYQAVLTPTFTRHPETQQIDIVFIVSPREQATVGHVLVSGSPGYSEEAIRKVAKFHPGDKVSASHANRALERLRKKYQKQSRWEAQVSITDEGYKLDNNKVDYVFHIERGPKVAIRIEGAPFEYNLVKKYVPVYEENTVDSDLLNEGRRNLRDYFQSKGYFDVEVNYKEIDDPGKDYVEVIYSVEKGVHHKLVAVVLDGDNYFKADESVIRDRMSVQPAGTLLEHGAFSTAMLSRDVKSIESLYKDNGFQQVRIVPEVNDDYEGAIGHMRVVLHIDEGPQMLVSSLKIVGAKSFPESEIRALLSTIEGQPFADSNIAADRDAITTFYFNRGFPVVGFESSVTPTVGNITRVNVTYTITEGERVFVNQVLISGLEFTKLPIVQREVVVRPGDPLSQQDLLDTQRGLYDLGIFNAVDTAVQNPHGEETYKDVLLNLYEAPRYTIDYGVGFEVQTAAPYTQQPQGRTGASPRVSFDITRTNFRGIDHTIFFKSHLGRLQQRGLLSYEAPHWFNRKELKLTFSALYDNTRDVTTFTSSRLEGIVQTEQKWSKATSVQYRFSYRLVKVDASSLVIDPNLIPLLSRPERIGMPSFTYFRDTRDDPIESHKGRYITFDSGISSGGFGSEANFARFTAQHSTYLAFHRRGKPNCQGCYVLAFSTRIGFEPPFGSGSSAIIPLPERFFSGGPNTLRGFGINQAGPRDIQTGNPLGGESMFVNNIELRFPPMPLPYFGKTISPVVFHDMGNVFATTGDLFPSLFHVTQKNREQCASLSPTATCDFNYVSHTLGWGIRYKTPIGPVRFDLGYNLNSPLFPIRSAGRSQTLKHWNFSFSIGQTF